MDLSYSFFSPLRLGVPFPITVLFASCLVKVGARNGPDDSLFHVATMMHIPCLMKSSRPMQWSAIIAPCYWPFLDFSGRLANLLMMCFRFTLNASTYEGL
jgi:hypothetical protein